MGKASTIVSSLFLYSRTPLATFRRGKEREKEHESESENDEAFNRAIYCGSFGLLIHRLTFTHIVYALELLGILFLYLDKKIYTYICDLGI